MDFYCYSHPPTDDPHAVVLNLSAEDRSRHEFVRQTERDIPLDEFGRWHKVTDVDTGQVWEVRSFPCGGGCRCAAQARTV